MRIERDTMGEMSVPERAYYGAQTARALRNFTLGGGPVPWPVLRSLARLKGEAAAVHAELGLLDAARANAIQQAVAELVAGDFADDLVVDVFQTGSGTSSNMNVNEVLANRADELLGHARGSRFVHPNDHVNLGQSSNDVFPSAVQIGLAEVLATELLPALTTLTAAWHAKADTTFEDVKTGRTHLMDAMPIRFGQVFRGYAGQCARARTAVEAAIHALGELPLGGTAVGTGVHADRRVTSAICDRLGATLGLELRETKNHFRAQSSLDVVVDASATMRTFATALYKIVNDVRWMASSAVDELRIPAVQPGSSIMPAKVNPVICEAVLMACGQVLGNDVAVAFGNSQGQFELNTMMPLLARNTIESAQLLARACTMLTERCVEGLTVAPGAATRVAANVILATALTPAIGYEAAAQIAKEAAASGRSVREVAAERTTLGAAELDALLDPSRLCGEDGRDVTS